MRKWASRTMSKVFVSYARADSRKVNRVLRGLEEYGFEFWKDVNSIRNGEDWPEEITKGIMDCSKFLLFMSAASMGSDNVRREVQIAYENKKKIITLRLDNSKLPPKLNYQLIGRQRTEYLSPNWEEQIVAGLGGGKASPVRAKPVALKHPSLPASKPRSAKQTSLRAILSELESAFSVNGYYYKDQCDAVLAKLDQLRVIISNHWVNPSLVYNELIPRAYLLEKIEILQGFIKDFQGTCPPGSPVKRQLIQNELRALLGEISRDA